MFKSHATMTDAKENDGVHEKLSRRLERRSGKVYHFFKELLFGGRHFCCCIPTRFGVVVGACLQFLVAGALAIILWFEVSTQHDFTFSHLDLVGFICAGVLETLLFVAAIIGFLGAIVRKQFFVTLYCGFLYVHFLVNLGAASFLTWKIDHTTATDVRDACDSGAIKNPGTQAQCKGILGATRGILLFVIWAVIIIEFYGVLIVTRYTRQLRNEKRNGPGHNYTSLGGEYSGRRHSRAASRRNLILTDDQDEDLKARSPLHTPGSADSAYRNPSATFFPLMPSKPMSPGMGGGYERRYSVGDNEEDIAGEVDTLVGSHKETV